MRRALRIGIALVVALVASVAAEVLLVDRDSVGETIYGDGLIGVWALLGIASVLVLVYGSWWAGRHLLQRGDDPYGGGDANG